MSRPTISSVETLRAGVPRLNDAPGRLTDYGVISGLNHCRETRRIILRVKPSGFAGLKLSVTMPKRFQLRCVVLQKIPPNPLKHTLPVLIMMSEQLQGVYELRRHEAKISTFPGTRSAPRLVCACQEAAAVTRDAGGVLIDQVRSFLRPGGQLLLPK